MKKLTKPGFFVRIVLPAMLAIILFVISVFAFIIPTFERNALSQKKTMLLELTNTAWSILYKYQTDEEKGLISLEEAQNNAIKEIEALRYGPDKKDYFWITDLTPVMIMHPYVQELTGKELHDFTDPDGKRLFIEALEIVNEYGEGFMNYKWQFKDDPDNIVPKLSFVKKFPSWNWVIGTGIYIDDVEAEISSLTNKLIFILLGITLIISMIIFFITYQSLSIENRRRQVEEQLRESREKYRSLLESSTEGIILLINYKISYANAFILNWLQYTAEELQDIPVTAILPPQQGLNFESNINESGLEVALIRKDRVPTEAVLTVLPVCFAGKDGLLLTFRDTNEHRSIKAELESLKTRLNNLSGHFKVGHFRFSLKGNNRLVEFNKRLAVILGYENEAELKEISLFNIIDNKQELKTLFYELKQKSIISAHRTCLRKKDNTHIEVLISLSLIENDKSGGLFCDGIIEPLKSKEVGTTISKISRDIASIFARNNQSAKDYCKPALTCPGDASIQYVIELMQQNNSNSILLMLNQKCIGIITYYDIVTRVLGINASLGSLASEFMSSPVISIAENYDLAEAAMIMKTRDISSLVVKNPSGAISGIISKEDLIGGYIDPFDIFDKAIDDDARSANLARFRSTIPYLVKPLLNETGNTRVLTNIISSSNEKITTRVIQSVMKELAQPPVSFAFFTFGSIGRGEMVFNSDQDNAIIYDDEETSANQEEIQNYFNMLSERICARLDETGLLLCPGGYMANNPKWCQPLGVWKSYFNDWIENPEPENIMNISVFFDLKFVYGDNRLFKNLEDHVFEILDGSSAFFYFLARSATGFKPPINLFGNIVTESTGKKSDTIDIKSCLAPVIMFSRIYALHNGIRVKGTIERINSLKARNILSQNTVNELLFHYHFLMQLRLNNQISQIIENSGITNTIEPKKITEMEQVILKKVFSQMNNYHEKLSAEFMSAFKG